MLNRKTVSYIPGLIVLFISLLIINHTALATTVVMPADDDLVIGARAIIRGRVLAIEAKLDNSSGRIFSYITIRVQQVLKGEITERHVVLKEEGGEVGALGSTVFGTPRFQVGERVFLYLDTWQDGSLRVHEMFLGKFSIIREPHTGNRVVVRDRPDENTTVLDSASLGRPARRSTSRMELNAYIAMVKSRVRATRRLAKAFEDTYYQGAALLAQPPEATTMTPSFQPQFALLPSGTPARWFEPDSGLAVVYTVNLDGAPSATTMDDMTAAMNAWSAVAGCSLQLVNGGPDSTCVARDSNTLVFNNCDGRFSPTSGCASILAIGGLNWDSSQKKTVNGITFNRAINGHISFNPYAACDLVDSCKLREIATHELGHTVGLNHSEFSDATMYAFAHFDGRCASLRQDDINGIVFVYPSASGGSLNIVTASPLPPAAPGTSYSQPLGATGGTSPYTWSLVAGEGSLPDGLALSSGGVISGTAGTEGTYNFTVQVADSGSGTAQKAFSLTVSTAASGYDSTFLLQSVPTSVPPGQTFFVTLRFVNSGTKTWDTAAGFKAVSQNPANNTTWGADQVVPVQAITLPTQLIDFTFQAVSPHSNGIYNFQWETFQPGVGFFGQKSTNVPIVVTDGSLPSISTPSPVDAPLGFAFNYHMTVSGGVPPYTWSIIGGTLPAGLTLSADGAISGTASVGGTVNVTCQVTDAVSKSAQKQIAFNVAPPPPEIATASLASGERNKSYSVSLVAQGGKPPYSWKLIGGALPAGLTLSSTGSISGTPTVDGSFDFTVEITDAESKTAQRTLHLTIDPPPLRLEAPTSLDLERGTAFSIQLTASGGRPPYSYSIGEGELPPGVTLNAVSGIVSGAPTANGSYSATLRVRDQSTAESTATIQIRVLDPGSIPVIKKAKYKAGRQKLTVKTGNADPAAVLLIDGAAIAVSVRDGNFVVKHFALPPGRHEIRVMNPGPILSLPVTITVN